MVAISMEPIVAATDHLQTEVQLGRGVDDDVPFARFRVVRQRRSHAEPAGEESGASATSESFGRDASFLSITPLSFRGIESVLQNSRMIGMGPLAACSARTGGCREPSRTFESSLLRQSVYPASTNRVLDLLGEEAHLAQQVAQVLALERHSAYSSPACRYASRCSAIDSENCAGL